jgi:hypothetical protein
VVTIIFVSMLSQVYRHGLRPWFFALDPEVAHRLAIASCQKIGESSFWQQDWIKMLSVWARGRVLALALPK